MLVARQSCGLIHAVRKLNPAAWYPFNTGITVTGQGVSQWSDASGNGGHLLQATDGARPVYGTPGANLAVNGNFATDTDWTKGTDWTIGSGVATKVPGAGAATITQTLTGGASGNRYLVTFTLTRAAGVFRPIIIGSTTVNGTDRSANGTYTEVLTAGAGTSYTWGFNGDNAADGTIDNVSIQLITADGSIYFDGIARYLVVGSDFLDQPITAYILYKQITRTSSDVILGFGSGANRFLQQTSSGSNVAINFGAVLTTTGPTVGGNYGITSFLINGANSLIQDGNSAPQTGDAGATEPTNFLIGVNNAASAFSNIQVKEVILYSAAHDAAQRAMVIGYLGSLGGIAL